MRECSDRRMCSSRDTVVFVSRVRGLEFVRKLTGVQMKDALEVETMMESATALFSLVCPQVALTQPRMMELAP